jgi:hypothetical protein
METSSGDEARDASAGAPPVDSSSQAPEGGPTETMRDGGDGGDDATLVAEAGEDAGDAAGPANPIDACGQPNDGGPIFAIAAWPQPPPPTIDGDLSEWPCTGAVDFSATNAAFSKNSSYALSADIQVRWDQNNVYVAARVYDSQVGGDDDTDPSNNDSVEIYVSGDPTLDGDYDPNTHQYITDWKNLTVDYGPVHAGNAAVTSPPSFKSGTGTMTGGWTFEASIGWQALYAGGNNKFTAGTNIALDFEVNDGDGTQQVAALVLTMAPAAASCTCTQANCCCGETPDVPSCDSQRITRVTLE